MSTAVASDDWLAIETPATARKPKQKRQRRASPRVEAATGILREKGRAPAMQRKLYGKDRIWACDGEYVYFRPTRMVNGVKTVVANPTTYQRHNDALAAGHLEYVETQDDVEIYRVTADSPFARRPVYLGELSDRDVRRQVAVAACKRDWTLYADALEELAGRIKNRGYDPNFGAQVWKDTLAYIDILIGMRQGPGPQECANGLQAVRRKRGVSNGRVIVQL